MSVFVHKGGVAPLAPWVRTSKTSWQSSNECGKHFGAYICTQEHPYKLFIHIIASLKAYLLHFSIISYYIQSQMI